MIKYMLIIMMLAALVLGPVSLLNVSLASTSIESLTIEGNGDEAEMLLVKEKGEQTKDISLSTDNVLAIEEGDDVTVQDDVEFEFTKALLTPSQFAGDPNKGIRVPITQDGAIDLDKFGTGVYSLFVVVDDNRAYECIIVIGEEDEETVNRTINKVNLFITIITEIIFENPEPIPEPEPPSVCYFDPNDPVCDPDENGDCPPGFGHNEDDRCIPVGKCPPGYVRADDDETGTCFEKGKDERIKECPDGSIRLIGDTCYYETPIPDGCEPGYELRDGICYEIPPLPEEPTPEPSQCKPCNAGPGEMCPDVCLPPGETIIIPSENEEIGAEEEIIDEAESQDSTDEEVQDQDQDQEQDDEPSDDDDDDDDDEIEMDEEEEESAESSE